MKACSNLSIYYLVLVLAFISIFSSCRDQEASVKTDWESVPAKPENSDDLFSLGQQLRFVPDSLGEPARFNTMVKCDGEEYLGVVNSQQNAIELYDISDPTDVKMVKRTFYQMEGDRGIGRIQGFTWVNEDSIFTVSYPSEGNIVSLVNFDGQLIRTIKRKGVTESYQIICDDHAPMYYRKGRLYLNREYYVFIGKDNRNVEEERDLETVVDFATGENLEFDTPFSDEALRVYYIYHRRKGAGSRLVYGCRYEHYIYTKSMDALGENGYGGKHLAKSRFIGFITPQPDDDMHWGKLTGNYYGIFHDPYRRVYYRIVRPPVEQAVDPISGYVLEDGEMHMSIIVLDEEFNIIGEQLFPAKRYAYAPFIGKGAIFVHPRGLYVSLNNPFNVSLKEDEIAFQLLQLKPEVLEGIKE